MKKSLVIFLHNLKDIIVISNCAKFHPKIRWDKGSNLRVKFVFYTAAIKMTELGKTSRWEVVESMTSKLSLDSFFSHLATLMAALQNANETLHDY